NKDADNHGANERRIPHSQVRDGGAAEIAGQEDGAEHGSARDKVEDGAGEFKNADGGNVACGEAELLRKSLYDGSRLHELRHGTGQQHQDRYGADDITGPKHFLRGWGRLRSRRHESFLPVFGNLKSTNGRAYALTRGKYSRHSGQPLT